MTSLGSTGSGGGAPGTKPASSSRSMPAGRSRYRKMSKRGLTERQQRELHPRRQVLRPAREVRPRKPRRRADRGRHVGDQRQVHHLLDDDAGQCLAPSAPPPLPGGQAFIGIGH
jgi:hypothetical protein